jgi:hypothetical protein
MDGWDMSRVFMEKIRCMRFGPMIPGLCFAGMRQWEKYCEELVAEAPDGALLWDAVMT